VPSLDGPGVIVIVGDVAAVAEARRVAGSAVRDGGDVLVAAPRRPDDVRAWSWIKDGADAAKRQARWSSREGTVVVAIAVQPDAGGLAYARSVIGALEPGHVRVVTATADPAWSALHPLAHAVELA
jgi:hypothetical protein